MSEHIAIEEGPCEVMLDEPKGGSDTVVVFLPGIRGGAMSKRYDTLVDRCVDAGLTIARVDVWKDNVHVRTLSLNDIYDAVLAVIRDMKERGYTRIVGIGKSFGGTVMLTLPSAALERKVLWAPAIRATETGGTLSVVESARLETVKSMQALTVDRDTAQTYRTPTLFIHGTDDEVVPHGNSERLTEMMPDAQLESIEGADHSYTGHEKELLDATVAFLLQK